MFYNSWSSRSDRKIKKLGFSLQERPYFLSKLALFKPVRAYISASNY